MNDQQVEAASQAKGLNAPRVTLDDLSANVKHVEFVKCTSKGGQVLRWAVLTTPSGFAVTGRPSVAVSPENDDVEIGESVAWDNAVNELWPLMGYALKEKLAAVPADFRDRVRLEKAELDEKIQKLTAFLQTDTYKALPESEQDLLTAQLASMDYYAIALATRIASFAS